jgi:hypothetical protein
MNAKGVDPLDKHLHGRFPDFGRQTRTHKPGNKSDFVRPPALAAAFVREQVRRSLGADGREGQIDWRQIESLATRGPSMKFYLIVPPRENRHYCTAVLLPSSVPPRGTSPDPPLGGVFRLASSLPGA